MHCEYCGAEAEDTGDVFYVCEPCEQKVKHGDYGLCYGCGHPLDPRGMCTAPMSVAD